MIFVGIFGALAADSWSDTRAARERETNYLAGLAEDFRENEADLTAAIQRGDEVIAAAVVLLDIPAGGGHPAIDSVTALLGRLHRLPTFEPVTKTYDNILGAGDLLTLRDAGLRSLLAGFQSQLLLTNLIQETQERHLVSSFLPYFMENLDYVAARRGVWEEAPEVIPSHAASVTEVLGTMKFRNWVGVRLHWAYDLRRNHERMLEAVLEVQTAIRGAS